MPPAKDTAKLRTSKRYSRNGCSRCKDQHVRCDEQKPSCGRCKRVRVKCPGYGKQLRWSTKYEVFRPGTPEEDSNLQERAILSKQSVSSEQNPGPPTQKEQESSHTPASNEEPTSLSPNDIVKLHDHITDHLDWSERLAFEPDIPEIFEEVPSLDDQDIALFLSNPSPYLPGAEQVQSISAQAIDADRNDCSSVDYGSELYHTRRARYRRVQAPAHLECDETVPNQDTISSDNIIGDPVKSLNHSATVLVEFYFKETAGLFSCYDSPMNPFRTTVSRLWDSSPLLYRTLQSMAAASLVEEFPYLEGLGKRLRQEAIEQLHNTTELKQDYLLAMLMLGGSAGWHDPQDLGLTIFSKLRRELTSKSREESALHDNDDSFFHQSMTYWEMLLSYVTDSDDICIQDESLTTPSCDLLDAFPHPWAGFARDVQRAVQKTGKLIRQQRKAALSKQFASISNIARLKGYMAATGKLEQYLHNLPDPLENTVIDPEDANTPVWHLLVLAKIYRLTGLVQIYHTCPDILDSRLARMNIDHRCSIPGGLSEHEAADLRNEWLTKFALQALNLLKSIPLESGTRDFQPFILVALSSELRVSNPGMRGSDLDNCNSQTLEVWQMRRFITGRLHSLIHALPPKPIRVCVDIVNATWKLMDAKAQRKTASTVHVSNLREGYEVYWMDVMMENGWDTVLA